MALSLDSLKRGKEIKPPTIFLYGVPGVGKSTLASESRNPVFIQTEEGLNTLDVVKFPLATSVDDVFQAIGVLANEEHKFDTLVLDSVDWFEQLVHRDVRKKHGETIFSDYGKGYKFAVPYFLMLLDGLKALRDKKNMAIMLLGHSKIAPFNAPDTPSYDRYVPDMHDAAATAIEEWCELVLFANYKTYVTEKAAGFNKVEGKASGKGDRVIYTQERPPFRAKNRYNLPPELPMNYGAIERAMVEGLKNPHTNGAAAPEPKAKKTTKAEVVENSATA